VSAAAIETSGVGLTQYLQQRSADAVKLHLGCGGMRWLDFVNIDLHPADPDVVDDSRSGCVADVFADIRRLGLGDACVDEMFSSHVLEHFPRWEAVALLRDWHRMLKVGGQVVLETPDFWRCVLWLFHPLPKRRRVARNQFYGNQWDELDYETHRYVWSAGELKRVLLHEIGFSSVKITHRTLTHYPGRDMRVAAIK
jgi:predicted SAM-dependent methyltransferase